MPLRPGSKNHAIIAVLRDGPATTGEIVAATGFTPKNACARLKIFTKSGRVRREPYRVEGSPCRWLWILASKSP
jgi:DNA-binding HxlR family transcriptional regulator